MSLIPTWVTPPGTLGTIPEGVFYSIPLLATADTGVYYKIIAGKLPPGIFIDETGILSGHPETPTTVEGVPFDVQRDTTSNFAIRAYTQSVVGGVIVVSGLADRTFSLTVTGQSTVTWTTPSGNIGTYSDGVQVSDLQVQYYDPDQYAVDTVTLIAGSLPPGLSISTSGVISGYILPNPDLVGASTEYSFTLRVNNGTTSDVRTFSLLVYAHSSMTADNTYLTADITYITADENPNIPPIITTPTGSIGVTRSDNFFSFQFQGLDFLGNAFQFIPVDDLPPGLTLDPNSGWLYGYIPFNGVFSTTYSFSVVARETDHPTVYSAPYPFTLTIDGPVSSDVVWLTPSDATELAKTPSSLGSIDVGATSTFYVEATNVTGVPLQYRLLSGSDSRLPQGLQLLPSGHIAGRASFDTFCVDSGATTFDVGLNTVTRPTTFDMIAIFTVNAYSINGLVSVNKTFSIDVIRRYREPYDNLYIQAMPPQNDRDIINSLLQDPSIFPPSLIYRNDDPNFGIAKKVVYEHAYGLSPATFEEYVASLGINHYWKNLTLGEIKTARALDDNGNIIYEVVYSEVIDNLINPEGTSVGKEVRLPFTVNGPDSTDIDTVYPNSLIDMRLQVIDTVGQISNVLPRWMLSRQANGQTLGFTPAWVIAYTKPGESGQIAYNVQTKFGTQLNQIDFEVDRYELDNALTKNWERASSTWNITNLVGDGNFATVTFAQLPSVPFALGDPVKISGCVPASFNGTYYVASASTTQVTYVNITNATATTVGTISTLPHWNPRPPTITTFDQSRELATWINNDDVITTWEDNLNTPASWTYGTPGPNGLGTIFDGNSLQFVDPVDMYSTDNTTIYDKYLVFPKRNILE